MEKLGAQRMASGLHVAAAALLVAVMLLVTPACAVDYHDALVKSIQYFEAQRSGKLTGAERFSWRGNSGLSDGASQGIDLVGGYYDAGDNVKYGLPMAFTVTMLSWSVMEYRSQLLGAGQLGYALDAIKWGTDYFIKAHPSADVLYGEVGDGYSDHACWMRPEDMTTSRTAYKIDASNPGSDLAGETAAAMAAASIVFRATMPTYADTLLMHSRQLFTFADTYRGTYDNSISVAQAFYKSWSGFNDELLWAAIWLYDATGEASYLDYFINNADTLGGTGWALDQFSWDNKYVGLQLKATKMLLDGKATQYTSKLEQYQVKAEYFLCAALQKNSGKQLTKSPGGMFWTQYWNNMQYVSTAAFLLTVASDYYSGAQKTLSHCTSSADSTELFAAAQQQVDYILGKNARGQSYLVGHGSSWPQHVHHRAASINAPVSCSDGFNRFYFTSNPNPYTLYGALVGGPDQNDGFTDARDQYAMTEPTLYSSATMVGVLARLSGGGTNSAGSGFTSNSAVVKPINPIVPGPSPKTHQSRQTRTPITSSYHHAPAIVITQTLVDQWVVNNKRYFKFAGKITNKSHKSFSELRFVVHKLYGTLWGIQKERVNGNIYKLPQFIVAFVPGQSVEFAYIHSFGTAQIYVRSYKVLPKVA